MSYIRNIQNLLLAILVSLLTTGCIHDHPYGDGVDPSALETAIELDLELKWGENETQANFSSRARGEADLRVRIEVKHNGEVVGQDICYPGADEISTGKIRRKLPFSLHALYYEVAVWCDYYDSSGTEYFNSSDLSNIKSLSAGTAWNENQRCGYSTDILDLRGYRNKWNVKLVKQMSLNHAGARFKLITTDMRRFVENEIASIEKGDTYTVTVSYSLDTADGFNAFSGAALRGYTQQKTTGPLHISYNLFGDEEIAEGFVFCDEDDVITATVTVNNSARMTVVKTPEFSFPVKRGMVSIVTGEFLSEMFYNHIKVDNMWEGEITIDI